MSESEVAVHGSPVPSKIHDFGLQQLDELNFVCSPELAAMYKLSPFVWYEDDCYKLLLRVVNFSAIASEKVARVHYGESDDGVTFEVDETPVIAPGPDSNANDNGGCEDPTLAKVGDEYFVYYSGWNEHLKRGELLLAAGTDIRHLEKRGIALPSSDAARNPKEAEITRVADGTWRLFFEYAHEDKSKIGIARSANVDGPWEVLTPLFEARADRWDSWHLSTGPILNSNPDFPVMFYNGATRDAHWRIGWVVFDSTYTRVLARCEAPIVLPHIKRNTDDTDIAFAASASQAGVAIHLYYSVADQYCCRAVIERV